MTSTRPYLLRALYAWIVDNSLTPYLLINAESHEVVVPREYVDNGKIILNVAPMAVQGLTMDNDWVSFSARFGGKAFSVYVPMPAVLAVYAKENGRGMFFQPEENEETPPPSPAPTTSPSTPPTRSKPILKRVK